MNKFLLISISFVNTLYQIHRSPVLYEIKYICESVK